MRVKCFVQVISAIDGRRSEAVGVERAAYARALKNALEVHPEMAEDLVLVLIDDVVAEGETSWNFSTAPLMKVSTFVENFGV